MAILRRFRAALVAVVLWGFGVVPSARADFSLQLSETGYSAKVIRWSDPGQGQTAAGTGDHIITFSGTYGYFYIAMSIADSNQPGTAQLASLTIANSSITIMPSVAKTLTVRVNADYSSPIGPLPLTLSSSEAGVLLSGNLTG